MDDTKHLLEQARSNAPETPFGLEDVRDRRTHRERRRRLGATVVGLGLTAAIVGGVAFAMVSSNTEGRIPGAGDGGSLASGGTVVLGPGEFSYQRIRLEFSTHGPECDGCSDSSALLLVESWWGPDDSGRIEVLEKKNYGIDEGDFGAGEFPDEGDLSAFPIEPAALEAFLLERSGSDGASPRPEVTPAPGVPLEEGQMWLAIRDYLGSTQYLNATPELRAAMLQICPSSRWSMSKPAWATPRGERRSCCGSMPMTPILRSSSNQPPATS